MAVLNASMHFSYLNSNALRIAGITDDAPDPPGGHFGRDADGRVNGVLGEMGAVEILLTCIDRLSLRGLVDNIHAITDDAARVGVTTMREAATGALMGEKEIILLRALSTLGRLRTRISLAVLDDQATGWDSEHVHPGAGDDRVWIGARKIVGDGSNQGRSGYLHEPYLGTTERGAMNIEPSALVERIAWCEEHGWQLMVHANGDATTQLVAEAYSKALGGRPGRTCATASSTARWSTTASSRRWPRSGCRRASSSTTSTSGARRSGTTCWAPSGPSSSTARPGPPGPGSGSRCTRTTT